MVSTSATWLGDDFSVPRRLPVAFDDNVTYGEMSQQWDGVVSDHVEYYSPEGLAWLTAGVGVGAAMANTGFDEHFLRHTYSENVVLGADARIHRAAAPAQVPRRRLLHGARLRRCRAG
ncbi:MAG: hypothetical protein R3C10_06165 [Pirellulales bacterium]